MVGRTSYPIIRLYLDTDMQVTNQACLSRAHYIRTCRILRNEANEDLELWPGYISQRT